MITHVQPGSDESLPSGKAAVGKQASPPFHLSSSRSEGDADVSSESLDEACAASDTAKAAYCIGMRG